jgi:hypothetical protein
MRILLSLLLFTTLGAQASVNYKHEPIHSTEVCGPNTPFLGWVIGYYTAEVKNVSVSDNTLYASIDLNFKKCGKTHGPQSPFTPVSYTVPVTERAQRSVTIHTEAAEIFVTKDGDYNLLQSITIKSGASQSVSLQLPLDRVLNQDGKTGSFDYYMVKNVVYKTDNNEQFPGQITFSELRVNLDLTGTPSILSQDVIGTL